MITYLRCTGFFCLAIIKGPPNDIYCIIEEPYKHYFTEKVSYSHLICDIIFNGLDDIFTNISSIHMAYLLRIGIDKYFAGNVILLNL